MFHLGMEWTLEHVEQPELARRPPEGGHREVVLEHDDVRRLFGQGFNGTCQLNSVICGLQIITFRRHGSETYLFQSDWDDNNSYDSYSMHRFRRVRNRHLERGKCRFAVASVFGSWKSRAALRNFCTCLTYACWGRPRPAAQAARLHRPPVESPA